MIVWTIGHSTHPVEEFLAMLEARKVELVADVRTIPRSRHVPQFNQETLAASLDAAGIAYVHMKKLGGLRHPAKDSPNIGWRNAGFRGYADYMQTEGFARGMTELKSLAVVKTTAIMCAEGLPWRCHRSLIADALLVEGFSVREIMPDGKNRSHPLTEFVRVSGKIITYPGEI